VSTLETGVVNETYDAETETSESQDWDVGVMVSRRDWDVQKKPRNISATPISSCIPGSNSYALLFLLEMSLST